MLTTLHLDTAALEAGLPDILTAPRDEGVLRMIVRRPSVDAREVLDAADLDTLEGLAGDSWRVRRSSRTPDGSPHPDMQLNIMSARVVALVAHQRERWPLAGDQLFVDLDLSAANVPPGTLLEVGPAIVQITDQPHTGCRKFVDRFGLDAMKFVNSSRGRELNLRGVCARVVRPGRIRTDDVVRKITTSTRDNRLRG